MKCHKRRDERPALLERGWQGLCCELLPVIGLSAAANVHGATSVANARFYRHLTKPIKIDRLMG